MCQKCVILRCGNPVSLSLSLLDPQLSPQSVFLHDHLLVATVTVGHHSPEATSSTPIARHCLWVVQLYLNYLQKSNTSSGRARRHANSRADYGSGPGTVYTRWGRARCDGPRTTLLYAGMRCAHIVVIVAGKSATALSSSNFCLYHTLLGKIWNELLSMVYCFSAYWLRSKCLVCCQHIDFWCWIRAPFWYPFHRWSVQVCVLSLHREVSSVRQYTR